MQNFTREFDKNAASAVNFEGFQGDKIKKKIDS